MLCCAVLCCAVLCCAVLCCAVLSCPVLCCAVLSCPVLYSTPPCPTLAYSTLLTYSTRCAGSEEEDEQELLSSVFRSLSGQKNYVAAKDLLDWDIVLELMGEVRSSFFVLLHAHIIDFHQYERV